MGSAAHPVCPQTWLASCRAPTTITPAEAKAWPPLGKQQGRESRQGLSLPYCLS